MTLRRWALGWVLLGLLPLVAGCVDYRVILVPEPPLPVLGAAPASLALTGVCGGEIEVVRLTNSGTGPATITAVSVEGMGWTLSAVPALPVVLAPLRDDPEAGVDVSLSAGAGVATLRVLSDAPDLDVPLRGADNLHPTVTILSPYESQVVGEDDDLLLTGIVSDGDEEIGGLSLSWSSDISGVIATAVADADGRVETAWAPEDRSSGPQTLSLIALDHCSDVGEATLFYCQDGPFEIDVLNEEAWRFDGGANYDGALLTLVDAPDQTASAFDLFSLFDADRLEVRFEFLIGQDGDVASPPPEGFSFTLLDPARLTSYVGGSGCGMGFGAGADCAVGPVLPGWSLAFDTRAGTGDCAQGDAGLGEARVSVFVDGDLQSPIGCVATPLVGAWRTAVVTVTAGRVGLAIDGLGVLDAPLPDGQDFEGFAGFTAATGVDGGAVGVRSVEVIDSTCVR